MNYARHREWELGLERRAEHEAKLEAARVRVFELAKDMAMQWTIPTEDHDLQGWDTEVLAALKAYEALAKEKP
jgi:hypothetical protein